MLSGCRAGEFGAAWFFGGLELHEFDASVVRVVEIELPFAVAADLGFFVAVPAVLAKLLFRGVDVRNAQSDMVHDTESVMVSVGWDVEHVFDPVGAIGDLHVHPAGFVVFPSAMPVDVKAQDVFVEAVFGDAIVHDEANVDNPPQGIFRRLSFGFSLLLPEHNLMALRIEDGDDLRKLPLLKKDTMET